MNLDPTPSPRPPSLLKRELRGASIALPDFPRLPTPAKIRSRSHSHPRTRYPVTLSRLSPDALKPCAEFAGTPSDPEGGGPPCAGHGSCSLALALGGGPLRGGCVSRTNHQDHRAPAGRRRIRHGRPRAGRASRASSRPTCDRRQSPWCWNGGRHAGRRKSDAGRIHVAARRPVEHRAQPGSLPTAAIRSPKGFAPIGLAVSWSYTLIARNDLPHKNLAELIAFARANPGKISYASAGKVPAST